MKIKIIIITIIFFININVAQSQTSLDIHNSNVPSWAKEVVWYQIFPERFSNGNFNNDPKPIDMQGGWPYSFSDDWQISPWTSDWYERNEWEKNEHDFYWNAGTRRYGGDLQGILNKLDYLQNLGITAIYLNPIFESPSLHKYDASMYHHIDNNFGNNPELDRKIWETENPLDAKSWKWTSADSLFLKLIDEVHKRDMKIIIDGVFNHVGTTFWAFQDVMKNQEKSQFADWFYIKQFDNPNTDENEFSYEGWNGVRDLPELKENENGLIPPIKQHIFDVLERWMDPNGDGNPADGIDGWRLDVAEMVKIEFWKEFRTKVKSINPNAYITGEIWWEDWKNYKMFDASKWLQGDVFDAVMNYRFTRAVKNFVSDKNNQIGVQAFWDSLTTQYNQYPKENLFVLMNLLGSHDTERLASMIVNPDIWYDHNGNPAQDKNWDVRKPNEIEIEKQKFMVAIQMLLPGAPMIYYGDEVGMWGGDDPDDRKPMIWKEFSYQDEKSHPFGKERKADKVQVNEELLNWYKKMISLRKSNSAFTIGEVEKILFPNNQSILSFFRYYGNEKFIVFGNNSEQNQTIKLSEIGKENCNLYDYLDRKNKLNSTEFSLKPFEIKIFKIK